MNINPPAAPTAQPRTPVTAVNIDILSFMGEAHSIVGQIEQLIDPFPVEVKAEASGLPAGLSNQSTEIKYGLEHLVARLRSVRDSLG